MSLDQVLVWFGAAFDGPFAVLILLLFGLVVVLALAQRHGKLDLAQMFKDDVGKESGLRFAILGAWIMSSWYLMADLVSQKQGDSMLLGIYLATWSGSAVFVRALEKWDGKFGGKA
tara:strand:+ start:208 stop:555 length:348 start_codon:yes stop_codon:yes gene_type:complete